MVQSYRWLRWRGLMAAGALAMTLSVSAIADDETPPSNNATAAVEELPEPATETAEPAAAPAPAPAPVEKPAEEKPAEEKATEEKATEKKDAAAPEDKAPAKPADPVPAKAPESAPAATAVVAPFHPTTDAEWVIVIRPDVSNAVFASVVEPTPATASVAGPYVASPCCGSNRMSYADALAEIGFSRAEYEANPAYRHESALELMFGQLRPTTVVKQTVPYFSRYPDMFRLRNAIYPYGNTLGDNSINLRHIWFYPGYY
jgi:hypothetical protein